MDKDKSLVISDIANMLLEDNETTAKEIIKKKYPHTYFEKDGYIRSWYNASKSCLRNEVANE